MNTNPESRIPNPESRLPNPESRIPNPVSRIPSLCLLILSLLASGACLSVPKPRSDAPSGYHDLVIRAKRELDGKMKGGRVMVKLQGPQGMILFLTPLSQVALKLELRDGRAVLFHPRNRRYWQGRLPEMMRALWNLPLDWEELSLLVLQGRLPPGREELGELTVTRREKSGWKEAELDGPLGKWRFTVLRRSFRQEPLPPWQERSGWMERELLEVLGDEEND